ncbi:MAG: NAD(P)-dependent oxidoreductase [Desulfuromonas sp.]|nr:MAG: NAD(P)-dependent oxidoreductase [Desulfuromonas sp.]
MDPTIFVIGATGNLGREVTLQLVAKELKVRVGVRKPDQYLAPSSRVEAVRFDFDDPTSFCPALDSIEKLFLIAPPLDPEAPMVLAPLIQAAKQAGVEQIVFTSALGVDQNEDAPLRRVERQLEASGIGHTVLRPNFFMDNFSSGFIAPMIQDADGIFVAAESAKTSFIATTDIAAVAVVCMTEDGHLGKAFNLTGPQGLDHAVIAAIISETAGRDVVYQSIPESALRQGAIKNGLPEPNVDYLAVLYQATRAGHLAATTPDVEQVLGRPPVSFEEFAQQNKAAWQPQRAVNG